MEKDIAIIHITDLHFPVGGKQPLWVQPFLECLKQCAEDTNLELFAFAVTGDLVDSPNASALGAVKQFLHDALITVGIQRNNQPDWRRVWIVDGNHDYGKNGLLSWVKRSLTGPKQTEELLRLYTPFEDDEGRFIVFGLNSSKRGVAARGTVEVNDLRDLDQKFNNNKFRLLNTYRIALLHHHLLPLPHFPQEWNIDLEKLKSIIEDESSMLLENAGLVTAILAKNKVNLILHGHMHKNFISRIQYPSKELTECPLTIVGGPAAEDGFQILRFRDNGDVDLVPYKMNLRNYNYEPEPPVLLWTYEEWKSWLWERQSNSLGSYDKTTAICRISSIGDTEELLRVDRIRAGYGKNISNISIEHKVFPADLGTISLDRVFDLNNSEEKNNLPVPSNEIRYDFKLSPIIKDNIVHKGYIMRIRSINSFCTTSYDAILRNFGGKEEYIRTVVYPSKFMSIILPVPKIALSRQYRCVC